MRGKFLQGPSSHPDHYACSTCAVKQWTRFSLNGHVIGFGSVIFLYQQKSHNVMIHFHPSFLMHNYSLKFAGMEDLKDE